jgi:hypothetical protein
VVRGRERRELAPVADGAFGSSCSDDLLGGVEVAKADLHEPGSRGWKARHRRRPREGIDAVVLQQKDQTIRFELVGGGVDLDEIVGIVSRHAWTVAHGSVTAGKATRRQLFFEFDEA